MFYYVIENGNVYRYSVSFSVKELLDLKEDMIDNHSEIIKVVNEGYGINFPSKQEGERIINYSEEEIGEQDFFDGPSETIYRYEYDKMVFPHAVSIIESLIDSNVEVLEEIYSASEEQIEELLKLRQYELQQLSDEINAISNESISEKIDKLNELKKLKNDTKILKQIDDIRLLLRIQALLTIEKNNEISLADIDKVTSFFKMPSYCEDKQMKLISEKVRERTQIKY